MGHLYHRSKKLKDGTTKYYKTWTYKFYYRGKQKYYDTGETNKRKAQDKAKKYEVEVKGGDAPWEYNRVRFEQLKELLILDYEINKKKSLDRAMRSAKRLGEHFEGYKAIDITTKEIQKYIKKRQDDDMANATINRELAALKRMFNLGAQQVPPVVRLVPYIPMLQENNTREGYFEHAQYGSLMAKIAPYMKGVIALAYVSGMRKEEILGLTWDQVDFKQEVLRLRDTKTGKRIVPLDYTSLSFIRWAYTARQELPEEERLPYVFLNRDGTDRIKDFRGTWEAACKAAKLGKRHFHDFRRTAVRNMIRAGTAEKVAMTISGHKTRSIFDRYNIINEKDLKEATHRIHEYLRNLRKKPKPRLVRKIRLKK